ncbi:MAG TPA: ceramidase domain-containing protein [Burkholderiales bacterium]|nr:ceramidase domain-containing protein [Burkholderiales bacterium]
MKRAQHTRTGRREVALAVLLLAPLLYLFLLHAAPIPQDRGYHLFADARAFLGLPNFGNVVTNLPFLIVGALGIERCLRAPACGARLSWTVFFAAVALVSFGSAYYHLAPGDDALLWDRLPMAVGFMALLAALLAEHLSPALERPALALAIAAGVASVVLWRMSEDLRPYIWVQTAPFLAILFLLAAYPGRYSHRHYLLYGAGFYAVAKIAEHYDHGIYALTGTAISGHSLKHLLAAAAPYCVVLMLARRAPIAKP